MLRNSVAIETENEVEAGTVMQKTQCAVTNGATTQRGKIASPSGKVLE